MGVDRRVLGVILWVLAGIWNLGERGLGVGRWDMWVVVMWVFGMVCGIVSGQILGRSLMMVSLSLINDGKDG